jgi:hypothetical protein
MSMHAQTAPEPVTPPLPPSPPPAPPGTELPGPDGNDISLPPLGEPAPAM